MKKLNILLVCGTGASSGFMAANIRKAANAHEIKLDIKARSESEIENYIDEVDCIMIRPHLSYLVDEIHDIASTYNVSVILMKVSYYATLNGEQALDHLLSELSIKN